MKKYLTYLTCLAMFVVLTSSNLIAQQLTKEERNKAIEHLRMTQDDLMKTVAGLSEAQLNYHPSEGAWSVADCMEHLALSESSIWGIVEMTLQSEPNPALRDSVGMSDEQIVGIISSRERKVQTQPNLVPKGNFGSYEGSMKEFKEKRKAHIDYVKTTKDDLRNRYFDFPFGKADAYQVVLFMSGHTTRHTAQIKEVMASEGFPSM